MNYRLDRLGWARAIMLGNSIYAYKGVSRPDRHARRRTENTPIINTLLACEEFMGALHYSEATYVSTCPDWEDDWIDHVKHACHTRSACPNGSDEEKAEYQEDYDRLVKDQNKRFDWACERVDWTWTESQVMHMVNDIEGIAHFLKEHPVVAVLCVEHETWVPIDDVFAFCPECDEPTTGPCAECPFCSYVLVEQGRPLNWPPMAPFPPRRDFAGGPLNVPPYED